MPFWIVANLRHFSFLNQDFRLRLNGYARNGAIVYFQDTYMDFGYNKKKIRSPNKHCWLIYFLVLLSIDIVDGGSKRQYCPWLHLNNYVM